VGVESGVEDSDVNRLATIVEAGKGVGAIANRGVGVWGVVKGLSIVPR
jgi:hypothetical protein